MEVNAILFFEAETSTVIRKGSDVKHISAGQIEQITNEKWADNIETAKVEALTELQELTCEGVGNWFVGVFEADPEGDDSELLWEQVGSNASQSERVKGANIMTALDFINAHAIRSREVLEFVLKNEIAKIEEKYAQYTTYRAAAKALEKTGQAAIARNILVSANNILAEAGFIQILYAYALTGDGVDYLSSADIAAIEALPYLKSR